MRNSDDLEPILARFRPVGPPAALRDRVLAGDGARGFGRALAEWLPAAAALLLVVLFHWLATMEQRQVSLHFPFDPVELSADVAQGMFP